MNQARATVTVLLLFSISALEPQVVSSFPLNSQLDSTNWKQQSEASISSGGARGGIESQGEDYDFLGGGLGANVLEPNVRGAQVIMASNPIDDVNGGQFVDKRSASSRPKSLRSSRAKSMRKYIGSSGAQGIIGPLGPRAAKEQLTANLATMTAGDIVKILRKIASRKGMNLANKTIRYGISRKRSDIGAFGGLN